MTDKRLQPSTKLTFEALGTAWEIARVCRALTEFFNDELTVEELRAVAIAQNFVVSPEDETP